MRIILALVLVFHGASAVAAENVFIDFVRDPIQRTHSAIEERAVDTLAREWMEFTSRKSDMNRFVKLINEANHLALDVAIKMASHGRRRFKDICDAVGMQIKKEPDRILSAMHRHSISAGLAETLFGCMPLHLFVDNIDARITETQLRMDAVSGVRDVSLADLRSKGLAHYRQMMDTLNEAKRTLQPG